MNKIMTIYNAITHMRFCCYVYNIIAMRKVVKFNYIFFDKCEVLIHFKVIQKICICCVCTLIYPIHFPTLKKTFFSHMRADEAQTTSYYH
uniref:dTDP-glucose 4,6-dehydratase n=1 Tax=uncultured marine virus TaxID=186617 RepID=A0A0F7LBG8_9VIRU|nr:dTDP-glucose 4,6-dehydratase [uncultured marine virus]